MTFETARTLEVDAVLLDVERWTSAPPFELKIEARIDGVWREIGRLDEKTPVGFGRVYSFQPEKAELGGRSTPFVSS